MSVTIWHDEKHPFGWAVGVTASGEGAALRLLHPREQEATRTMAPLRSKSWVLGRLAMQHALVRVGVTNTAVLANDRGAPILPSGLRGSISHKDERAVALVVNALDAHVGIDLEVFSRRRADISRHALTEDEMAADASLGDNERMERLLLRFSLKEAIYKAIDPFLQRYVAFKEVRVDPLAGGATKIDLRLVEPNVPVRVEAHWLQRNDICISTARAHIETSSSRT